MPALWLIAACLFLTGLGFGINWAFTNRGDRNSDGRLAFWQGVIRYTIAIDLIMIGLQGFFGLLFFVHLGALDLPFSSLSGEELTWAYFGHYSPGFVYFLGCVQILGAVLLLFRRTRRMGIFMLIPVMVVIVALNYFFDMEKAETVQAIELLIQLLFLLFADRQKLYAFFISEPPAVTAVSIKPSAKIVLRISAVVIPLLLLLHYPRQNANPWLTGKYAVSHLASNHHEREARPCNDSLLTRVYFDVGNDCVFEFNSTDRRWYGTYRLSEDNSKIAVVWHYPAAVHDTLTGQIKAGNPLEIIGKIGKDSIQVSLVKRR